MTSLPDDVRAIAARHLDAIHQMFIPASKILVVVVFPASPSHNWLLGDATIQEAIAGLRSLQQDGLPADHEETPHAEQR